MAIKLPYQQTEIRQLNQYQQAMSAALQPITSLPTSQSVILTEVSLVAGANVVPTKINRTLQGWYIVRLRGPASIYDTQDTNTTPTQTLNLVSSANVVADIIVF